MPLAYDSTSKSLYQLHLKKVGLGDGHTLDAVGVGTIEIKVRASHKASELSVLHDVLHVLNLFFSQICGKQMFNSSVWPYQVLV